MSKIDLIAAIAVLATSKGVDEPETKDLSNRELETIHAELTALPDAEGSTGDAQSQDEKDAAKKAKQLAKQRAPKIYTVASHHVVGTTAISCKSGIIAPGQRIATDDLVGGESTFRTLVTKGRITAIKAYQTGKPTADVKAIATLVKTP